MNKLFSFFLQGHCLQNESICDEIGSISKDELPHEALSGTRDLVKKDPV